MFYTLKPGARGSTPESKIAMIVPRPSYWGYLDRKDRAPVSFFGTRSSRGKDVSHDVIIELNFKTKGPALPTRFKNLIGSQRDTQLIWDWESANVRTNFVCQNAGWRVSQCPPPRVLYRTDEMQGFKLISSKYLALMLTKSNKNEI